MTRAQSKLRIEIRQLDFAFVCTLKRALTRLLLLLLLLLLLGSYFAPETVSLLSFCAHVSIILFALSLSLDSVRPTDRPSVLWCNIKTSYTESSEEGEEGGGPSCIVYLLP